MIEPAPTTATGGERLLDRVVLITGAGSGIGRHYADVLAAAGAHVVVGDIDADAAARTAETIDGSALALQVDVVDETSVDRMAQSTLDAFGRIDVLVNNVGTYPHQDFDEITYADWRRVMAVNLDSVFLCSRAVVPAMRARGEGKIVNVATNLVWIGLAGMVHYVAAKAGVVGFTRALARELGDDGITVNAIAPGAVAPPVHLLDDASLERLESIVSHQSVKWCERPKDLSGTLLFLCSADSDFISGQVITVDGGLTNH